jgi:hypothetical protein
LEIRDVFPEAEDVLYYFIDARAILTISEMTPTGNSSNLEAHARELKHNDLVPNGGPCHR